MKYTFINACLVSFFSLTLLSGCNTKSPEVVEKEFELVCFENSNVKSLKVSFLDGEKQIPYFKMEDIPVVYNLDEPVPTVMEIDSKKEIVTMKRNNETAVFDFTHDTITVSNINTIGGKESRKVDVDVLSLVKDINDTTKQNSLIRDPAQTKYEFFGPTHIDLSNYHIDLKFIDKKAYIPCQTFIDIFLARQQYSVAFNGDVFVLNLNPLENNNKVQEFLENRWKKKELVTRSRELAEYSYNELCLSLDMNYGLKELRNIDSFDTYFKLNGFKEDLLDSNPLVSSEALLNFISFNIDDLHSTFVYNSPFCASSNAKNINGPTKSYYLEEFMKKYSLFSFYFNPTQSPALPNIAFPWYKESGDTAFVYFNTFRITKTDMKDYYSEELKKPENELWYVKANDTLGLIQYAHKQITRSGSPIKNVVLDLSTNSGGVVDAAAYVLSWFIGGINSKIRITTTDALTKAKSSVPVFADVNLDGKYDN